MAKPNICFVVFRYQHHSPHSGYSRLAEYGVPYFQGEVIRVTRPLSRFLIRDRMLWALAKGTPGYDRASMSAELKVALRMVRERNKIFHFLYGETTYHYSGSLSHFRNNPVIATFHLPPEGIQNAVQIDWHLRKLSAIICVGESQLSYFEDIVDHDRIFFVPLGVDIEYYTPPENFEDRDPNLCLVVGENYRDYPTLRGVIELVSYIRPKTKFIVVTPPHKYDRIGQHANMQLVSGIPETELLALYRKATLLCMPLTDATANNAVLESMACGLPMVISDVGSIRSYVEDDCARLVEPHNARKMAEAVVDVLDNPDARSAMAVACRERAQQFSWRKVMEKLAAVYARVG